MRFCLSILLLLSIVVKLFFTLKIDCDGNTYENNPRLLPKLQDYLYTVYASVANSNNEIFKFGPILNTTRMRTILARTTNNAKCCKRMYVLADTMRARIGETGGHFQYIITNDNDCGTQLYERAHMKLLSLNTDADGSYCIIVWTCRTSQEDVNALCTNTKISDKQKKWISSQYKQLGITEIKVLHNTDYKNGKCFDKKP